MSFLANADISPKFRSNNTSHHSEIKLSDSYSLQPLPEFAKHKPSPIQPYSGVYKLLNKIASPNRTASTLTGTPLLIRTVASSPNKAISPKFGTPKLTFTSALLSPQIDSEKPSFGESVYLALKDQKRNLLSASSPTHIRSNVTSVPQSPSNTIRLIASKNNTTEQLHVETKHRRTLSKDGDFSPRKRLAMQGTKNGGKKMTMKDVLNKVKSIENLPLKPMTASPKNFASQQRRNSKERTVTAGDWVNDEDILLEEDAKVSRDIHRNGQKGFYDKLALYNKYYTNYLIEPQEKFSSKADLRCKKGRILVPRQGPLEGISSAKLLKKMQSQSKMFHESARKEDEVVEDWESTPSSTPRSNKREFKERLGTLEDAVPLDDVVELRSKILQSNFELKMTSIRDNIEGLEKFKGMLQTPSKGGAQLEEMFLTHVKNGKIQAVDLLLKKHGHLVHFKDISNQTPLHWAVKRGHLDMVEYLCKKGADIGATDIVGRKPADIAKRFGEIRIEQMLEFGLEEQLAKNRIKVRGTAQV